MTVHIKGFVPCVAFLMLWGGWHGAAAAADFAQDFRGCRYDAKVFRPSSSRRAIHAEAQGLRITLTGHGKRPPVALVPRFGIRGDFQITMAFELLRVDKPNAGDGAGVSIYVTMASHTREAASIAQVVRPGGDKLVVAHWATTPPGGQRAHRGDGIATEASSGQLRLVRRGAILTYLVAPADSTTFREVYQTEFGSADIDMVRFAADSGGATSLVDVRIRGVSVRADELAPARPPAEPIRWPLWLAGGLTVLLLAAGGFWLRSRSLRAAPLRTGITSVLVLAVVAASASAVEFRHDFRGSKFNAQMLRYEGPTPLKFITPQPDGLRWRFSPGSAPTKPVGIHWRSPVRGNFSTTADFEILHVDKPEKGHGAGAELYLMLDNTERDAIAFARLVRPEDGPVALFLHLSNDEAGQRRTKTGKIVPMPSAGGRGRLRLVREDADLVALIAQGDGQEYTELHRTKIGAMNVRMLRFAGTSGGDAGVRLDMRLFEFDLRRLEGGLASALAPVPPQDGDASSDSSAWILLGSGAVLVVAGLAFLFVVWRRGSAPAHDGQAAAKKASTCAQSTGHDAIVFACSSCGRKLKAKAELAGKKVKCAVCAKLVAVPQESVPATTAIKILRPSC
jgi:hypothetical protein